MNMDETMDLNRENMNPAESEASAEDTTTEGQLFSEFELEDSEEPADMQFDSKEDVSSDDGINPDSEMVIEDNADEAEEEDDVDDVADDIESSADEAAVSEGDEPAEPKAEEQRPRYTSRRLSEPVKVGKFVQDDNDMLVTESVQKRMERDLDEVKRAMAQNRNLTAMVTGEEPFGDNDVKIVAVRNTLRIVFDARDFFHYSAMPDGEHATAEQRREWYRRRARLMVDSYVTFRPIQITRDEAGSFCVIASRALAMSDLRKRHFYGRHADVGVGTCTRAAILTNGPAYCLVEVLGVEVRMNIGELSAFEYIPDVSKNPRFARGKGLEVIVTALEVDSETDTVKMRVSCAALERLRTPSELIANVRRGATYGGRVISVHEGGYRIALTSPNVVVFVKRGSNISNEMLEAGDRVTVLIYGVNVEEKRIWGGCHKA